MSEFWVEPVGEVFKLWVTGEDAKTCVLQRIVERLAPSKEEDAFEKLVMKSVEEAYERIQKGQFAKPNDWIFSVSSLLSASRVFDCEKFLQDQAKLFAFRGLLESIVAKLTSKVSANQPLAGEVLKRALEFELRADYVLIGYAESLKGLAEALQERGKIVVVIDPVDINIYPEGKPVAISAITNVRKAIAVFGVEGMPNDKEIIEAIMEVKKSGKPVIYIAAPTITLGSILKIGEAEA